MPGINLLFSTQPILSFEPQLDQFCPEATECIPNSVVEKLILNKHTALVLSTNPSYQVHKLQYDDWLVFYECLGSPPSFLHKLHEYQTPFVPTETELEHLWSQYFADYPGSIFWLAYNTQSQELLLGNDALGRLPVYSYADEHLRFWGRDIALAVKLANNLTPNPLYLALYLSFCYVPGRGSVYDELDTFPPATMVCLNTSTSTFVSSSQPTLRFIEPRESNNYQDRLMEVTDSFLTAARQFNKYPNCVLALSGGMDSRLVAAAFSQQRIPFSSISYLDNAQTASDDLVIARILASKMQSDYTTVNLPQESTAQFERLKFLKQGVNYLGMSFFLDFMDAVAQRFPHPLTFVTGDGGDKVLPSLMPSKHLDSAVSFLNHLYSSQTYFSPQVSSAVFGISPALMDEYLLRLIAGYPTTSYNTAFKYFLLAERSARWLFEGEDRNRSAFSSETPFFDYAFYKLAMQIPDAWKADNLFYIRLMRQVSPTAGELRLANSHVIPNRLLNPLYRNALSLYRFTLSHLRSPAPQSTSPAFPMRDWLVNECSSLLNRMERNPISPQADILDITFLQQLNRSQLHII